MFWLVISLYQQGIYLTMVFERCVVICKNNGYFSLFCFSIGNLDLVDLCSRYDIYLNLFSSIFCWVLLWAEDLYGNFLVWLFLVWQQVLLWQFSMESHMAILLCGFYKENFHRSTCFLMDFCLFFIYFLLRTPILSYFYHF